MKHFKSCLFCTISNDTFIQGTLVMLYSLNKHVKGFNKSRLKIFYNHIFCQLSTESKQQILTITPHAEFEEVREPLYELGTLTDEFHRPAFLTFETFRQIEMDQVVFFDSDMLCIRDFSEVLTLPFDFAAVRCRSNGGALLNTGFFIIKNRLISLDIYEKLLTSLPMDYGHMVDQPLINWLIKEENVKILELEPYYNYLYVGGHPEIPGDEKYLEDLPKVRILHWAGRVGRRIKPWDKEAPDFPSLRRWKSEQVEMQEKLKHNSYEN